MLSEQRLDRLYGAALGLCGSRSCAEELVQETLTHVLSQRRERRGDDQLCHLMRTLRRAFLAGRSGTRTPPAAEARHEDLAAAGGRAGSGAERPLEIGEVLAAVSQLPEQHRLALVAVDVLGLSHGGASSALEVRDETLAALLVGARRAFSALIAPSSR